MDANLLNTTALQSFRTIRPTSIERAYGRLMRAPDHDAGSGDAGADQGDSNDKGSEGSDGGSDAAQPSGEADAGDADASLLGGAKSDAGDGGDGESGKDDADDGKGDKDKADAEDKSDGPPEAYELKVTVPGEDGNETEIEIDQQLLTEATPVLKELGLNNEQANKVAALVPKVQERVLQTLNDDFAATRAQWTKEIMADKEIGGANWPETEALCARALDTFGAPSEKNDKGEETNPFRVLLNTSGFGDHPDTIRMFRRIGEAVGEDSKLARSDAAAPTKKSQEEILYPDDVPTSKQGAK